MQTVLVVVYLQAFLAKTLETRNENRDIAGLQEMFHQLAVPKGLWRVPLAGKKHTDVRLAKIICIEGTLTI